MGLSDLMENLHHSSMSAHEKGERIIELLEDMLGEFQEVRDTLQAEDDQDTFIPYVFQGVTDAAGNAVVIMERRPGYVLELISFAAVGQTANAGFQVYANDQTPQNLIFAGTLQQPFWSDRFQEGSVIPDGSKLIVVWSGAGNTVNVTATLRGKKRMLDGATRNDVTA